MSRVLVVPMAMEYIALNTGLLIFRAAFCLFLGLLCASILSPIWKPFTGQRGSAQTYFWTYSLNSDTAIMLSPGSFTQHVEARRSEEVVKGIAHIMILNDTRGLKLRMVLHILLTQSMG